MTYNIQMMFKKILYILSGGLFLFVIAGSVHHISVYARMTAEYTHNQECFIIAGMVILLVVTCLFSHFVSKTEKYKKWIVRALWLILFSIEAFFIYSFYCYPASDSAEVVNAAIQLANGNNGYMEEAGYFSKYANNNLLTIATGKIYEASQYIFNGKTDYIRLNNFINIVLLNISVYLGYRMMKKIWGGVWRK